jgi:hypothetical protein
LRTGFAGLMLLPGFTAVHAAVATVLGDEIRAAGVEEFQSAVDEARAFTTPPWAKSL